MYMILESARRRLNLADVTANCRSRKVRQEAEKMLKNLGFDQDVIDRVTYLVDTIHTYTDIDGMDYQISCGG